jgi:phosphonate transport system ATP-binding protein
MRYLKKAADQKGLTTVTSLHQVNIAREFGDRFLGIRDGEVIFDGDADDLTMEVMDEIYYGGDAGESMPDPATTGAAPNDSTSDSDGSPTATPDGGESA